MGTSRTIISPFYNNLLLTKAVVGRYNIADYKTIVWKHMPFNSSTPITVKYLETNNNYCGYLGIVLSSNLVNNNFVPNNTVASSFDKNLNSYSKQNKAQTTSPVYEYTHPSTGSNAKTLYSLPAFRLMFGENSTCTQQEITSGILKYTNLNCYTIANDGYLTVKVEDQGAFSLELNYVLTYINSIFSSYTTDVTPARVGVSYSGNNATLSMVYVSQSYPIASALEGLYLTNKRTGEQIDFTTSLSLGTFAKGVTDELYFTNYQSAGRLKINNTQADFLSEGNSYYIDGANNQTVNNRISYHKPGRGGSEVFDDPYTSASIEEVLTSGDTAQLIVPVDDILVNTCDVSIISNVQVYKHQLKFTWTNTNVSYGSTGQHTPYTIDIYCDGTLVTSVDGLATEASIPATYFTGTRNWTIKMGTPTYTWQKHVGYYSDSTDNFIYPIIVKSTLTIPFVSTDTVTFQTRFPDDPEIEYEVDEDYPNIAHMSWDSEDVGAYYKYKLDNGTWSSYAQTKSVDLTIGAPGEHTFHVIASFDNTGEWESTDIYVSFNTYKFEAPTNIQATVQNVNNLYVTWDDPDEHTAGYTYQVTLSGATSMARTTQDKNYLFTAIGPGNTTVAVTKLYVTDGDYNSDTTTSIINVPTLSDPNPQLAYNEEYLTITDARGVEWYVLAYNQSRSMISQCKVSDWETYTGDLQRVISYPSAYLSFASEGATSYTVVVDGTSATVSTNRLDLGSAFSTVGTHTYTVTANFSGDSRFNKTSTQGTYTISQIATPSNFRWKSNSGIDQSTTVVNLPEIAETDPEFCIFWDAYNANANDIDPWTSVYLALADTTRSIPNPPEGGLLRDQEINIISDNISTRHTESYQIKFKVVSRNRFLKHDSEYATLTYDVIKLAAPTGLAYDNETHILTWNTVVDATKYNIYLNNIKIAESSTTSYLYTGSQTGLLRFSVIAEKITEEV